jgi:hypothetical protein
LVVKGRAPFEVRPGEQPPPSSDPLALLNYALAHGPEVQIINFAGIVIYTSPGDHGDGPSLGPYAAVELPPEVQDNLAGPPEEQDAYILIHIGREAIDAMDEPPLLVLPPPGLVRAS